jgi:hypothetical protein
MTDLRYRALLIGNSTFPEDPHNLPGLEDPINDIALLRDALTDSEVELFHSGAVRMTSERTASEILVELETFFGLATKESHLLLYYSGHGLLNEANELFLCARDTRTSLLRATAVSSTAINSMIDGSAAQTTIIILDCCHSGAFKSGDLSQALKGTGRFLLTSCRSRELAHDAHQANHTSVFTHHLVEGLLVGARATKTATVTSASTSSTGMSMSGSARKAVRHPSAALLGVVRWSSLAGLMAPRRPGRTLLSPMTSSAGRLATLCCVSPRRSSIYTTSSPAKSCLMNTCTCATGLAALSSGLPRPRPTGSSSRRLAQRIRDLRLELQPWSATPAVRALDEQLLQI